MFDIDRYGRLAVNTGLLMISIGGLVELRRNRNNLCGCTQTNFKNGLGFLMVGSTLNMYSEVKRIL